MTLLAAANHVSSGEAVTFWILGPVALIGALGLVLARNAIHSALFLVMTMGALGVLYFVQQGPFLGVVQIIVYTGAIMILFLFVLMLVGRDSSDSVVETLRGQRVAATLFGLGFAILVGTALGRSLSGVTPKDPPGTARGVEGIAATLFHDYLFAFELTSALLITAAVGAMVLAHREREPGTRRTQRQLSRERFRTPRPQPLPGPGVFATSDSVATPAMLPDGSLAPDSLSRLVEPNLTGAHRLSPPDAPRQRRRALGAAGAETGPAEHTADVLTGTDPTAAGATSGEPAGAGATPAEVAAAEATSTNRSEP